MRGREWIFGPTTQCRRARTLGSAPTPLEIQSDANKWIGLAMLHADINTYTYSHMDRPCVQSPYDNGGSENDSEGHLLILALF